MQAYDQHVYNFRFSSEQEAWYRIDDSEEEIQLIDNKDSTFLKSVESIDLYKWEVVQTTSHQAEPNHCGAAIPLALGTLAV